MRTTVSLDADVEAAVERIRRERGLGLSEVINELARRGLAAPPAPRRPFEQRTSRLALDIDVTNIADAIDLLDGPATA